MKTNLLATLLTLATLALASCSKNSDPQPEAPDQLVYNVNCHQCLVYVDDNTWNGEHPQHFNVSGSWRYAFVPKQGLDSVRLRVYTTQYQSVVTSISYKGKLAGFGAFMGYNLTGEDYPVEKVTTLKLK